MKYHYLIPGILGNHLTTEFETSTTVPPRTWPIYTTWSTSAYGTRTTGSEGWFVDCGGNITSPQTITSPNFPDNYPKSALCDWIIDLGYPFEIIMDYFEIEKSNYRCKFDYFYINDLNPETKDFYCGSNSVSTLEGDARTNEEEILSESPEKRHHWHVTTTNKGFSLRVVPLDPKYYFDIFQKEIQRIIGNLPENKFKKRFTTKMTQVLTKFESSTFEDPCYKNNGFSSKQQIATEFESDNFCDAIGQLSDAINSFAANFACDRRGKLFRKITGSARKAKNFFMKKQNC
ncbi:Oidioi.mRNA.OKI2018_I69.PAR.g8671.t1.cds [Oikopleura dioica]|uniref:Oidioi.mRNA.OKI2018_I69.PAR.g8671.t1.cds n=1 Tax=Oikopleura dioica TaxID=34765 RepID=A0ABN7RN31_OIKDI|nr:Oidioi.mRNA.OKI2018_I69.PAR.g8671.t1.cds [Oikopleura dioica]